MEPEAAAWAPWDSQLTRWSMEQSECFQMANSTMEPAIWTPGLPVGYQYAATELFGSFLQTSNPASSNSGGQMIQNAADTQKVPVEKAAAQEFEEAAREFKVDMDTMRLRIHRYPPSLRQFDEWYTVSRMVAMGPYHHFRLRDQPKQVEKVKHVAAHHCIRESGHSLQEVYGAVVSAGHNARHLYDKDVMADLGDDDFLPMMFYDACFLVQYMLWCTDGAVEMDVSLHRFFDFNRKVLRHDLMLFENQLPWSVVETVMRFRPVNLADFISDWRDYLQDRKVLEGKAVILVDSYELPHLLGLLRFYMVGRSKSKRRTAAKLDSISVSVSAIELAEIGITLTAAKDTIELVHMGVNMRGILSAELSLVPLSLDDERASFLLNMVALELCTTSNFRAAEDEDSAVCSYLLLLSMLVHREEDVQELRKKHLLQGGAGLVNKDALDFFTMFQSLPLHGSSCYVHVMVEIEKYDQHADVDQGARVFLQEQENHLHHLLRH